MIDDDGRALRSPVAIGDHLAAPGSRIKLGRCPMLVAIRSSPVLRWDYCPNGCAVSIAALFTNASTGPSRCAERLRYRRLARRSNGTRSPHACIIRHPDRSA